MSKFHNEYKSKHESWNEAYHDFTRYLETFSRSLLMSLLGDWYWPILAADVEYVAAALENAESIQKLAALEVKDGATKTQVEDLVPEDDHEGGEGKNFIVWPRDIEIFVLYRLAWSAETTN